MTWFISDYHFYHELARIRSRDQFGTVEEMNSFIISRNNQYVQPSDTLYILGDVIVRPETISKAGFRR